MLKDYFSKRDTARSGEPGGGRKRRSGAPLFVIQKHDASSLHYDFRLEIDGVLKSWAVPKGPSTDPREKRLAIETDDHPLDYADFEGIIPQAEYGGGTVMVWDRGSFRNLKDHLKNGGSSLLEAWKQGHLTVFLEGEKLTGGYALTRMRKQGKQQQWLLVKMDDDAADARRNPVSSQPDSVVSGDSLKQIARKHGDS